MRDIQEAAKQLKNANFADLHDIIRRDPDMIREVADEIIRHHGIYSSAVKNCEWTEDGDDGRDWNTGCRKLFSFSDGRPADNSFEFCPFCGGQLIIPNEADS